MIRAAFATGDGININRHFGIADRFDIYEIDIENNEQFVIPKPMIQERLEEILIEFGLMDNIKDNYHI